MTSIIKDIYNKSSKEIDIQKSFNIKTRLLKSILECSVFATCVILLYYKMISLTFFIAMTYYVYRFTWLIENINDLTQTYQKVSVSISRVNDILENRLYKDEEFGNKKLVNVKGVIEFKDVNFNYPDAVSYTHLLYLSDRSCYCRLWSGYYDYSYTALAGTYYY